MAKVKFFIRDPKAIRKTSIKFSFTYSGKRIRISTGEQIFPAHWNNKAERVREIIDEPEAFEINSRLKSLESLVCDIYKNFIRDRIIPTPKELMQEIENQRIQPTPQNNNKGFWDLFNEFVEYKRKRFSDVRDFDNSLRKHLLKGELKFKKPITFISLKIKHDGFIEKLDTYLTYEAENSKGEKGLATNTIGKQFKNLKVFLNWCFQNEYIQRFDLSHMITKTEEVDSIFLNQEEVDSIFNLKDLSEEEDIIRDLFIIGIESGLRYSDFIRLKPHYFDEDILSINPIKTESHKKNRLKIPISNKIKEILLKRNGLPPVYEGKLVNFNKTMRNLAEKAEIISQIVTYKKIGGKTKESVFKKYQLVSSHTCRRTFCTLKFLSGMPPIGIMQFSGHKTERNFLRYVKVDNQVAVEKYRHFFE
jgi:integrase